VDELEFEVGDVVKLEPGFYPFGEYDSSKSPIFVVEKNSGGVLTCKCICPGDAKTVGITSETLYFGPSHRFVHCSIKDKFRGRDAV